MSCDPQAACKLKDCHIKQAVCLDWLHAHGLIRDLKRQGPLLKGLPGQDRGQSYLHPEQWYEVEEEGFGRFARAQRVRGYERKCPQRYCSSNAYEKPPLHKHAMFSAPIASKTAMQLLTSALREKQKHTAAS